VPSALVAKGQHRSGREQYTMARAEGSAPYAAPHSARVCTPSETLLRKHLGKEYSTGKWLHYKGLAVQVGGAQYAARARISGHPQKQFGRHRMCHGVCFYSGLCSFPRL